MFGKRAKLPGVPMMHYQGLKEFPQDFPCFIEYTGESLIFRKVNPEVTVTLPVSKVIGIENMPEENYMLMHHNAKVTTAKVGMKWYFVIKYQGAEGPAHIDVWAPPGKEVREMQKIGESITAARSVSTSYTL